MRLAAHADLPAVFFVVEPGGIDGPVLARGESQRGAEGCVVSTVNFSSRCPVLPVTVVRLVGDGEAAQDVVAERHVDHGAHICLAVIARAQQDLGFELRLGLHADDVHRPTGHVLTEQRALGTAHHLDALDVQRAHEVAQGTREVVAVDVHTGAEHLDRIRKAAANATNVELVGIGAILDLEVHVGREIPDLARVVDALGAHGGAGDGDHGQRRVHEGLLAPAGRHGHLFEYRLRCRLGLCSGLLYRHHHRRTERRRSSE